jgi:hypothetical protein
MVIISLVSIQLHSHRTDATSIKVRKFRFCQILFPFFTYEESMLFFNNFIVKERLGSRSLFASYGSKQADHLPVPINPYGA